MVKAFIEAQVHGTRLDPQPERSSRSLEVDRAALTAVWLGRLLLAEAIAAGSIRVGGGGADARPLFSRWFGLSPFADGGAARILAGLGAP